MTTVHDVVKRALTRIQVINPVQQVSAKDMQTGIGTLNEMMMLWESYPLPLGWQNVSNPDSDMPTPPEAEGAIVSNLAVRLAPEYGVDPSVILMTMASEGLSVLRRQFLAANPLDRNVALPLGSGARRWGMRFGGWWPYP